MCKYLFYLFLFVRSFLQATPERLQIQVISTLPHDTQSFTQGLLIIDDVLFESTGQYGFSSLQKRDLKGNLLEKYNLPPRYFGEGIAYLNGQITQLTWQEEVAFIYDINPIKLVKTYHYTGPGWGLCSDGQSFFMTNGSSELIQRNGQSFNKEGQKNIRLNGANLYRLNAIMCLNDEIYANVWMRDEIFRINKQTGEVTGIIDASNLLTEEEKKTLSPEAVLNGVAYREKTKTFYITGKYWPKIFEVRFLKP